MLDLIFQRETRHGLCVAMRIPEDGRAMYEALPIEERVVGASFGDKRRRTFAAGRTVLRYALGQLGVELKTPLLRDDRGAPVLPDGVLGSLSHKETFACALVAKALPRLHIGVDTERLGAVRAEHASLILTQREEKRLRTPHDWVLALSLKESLYKALDPFVHRFVGFKEVEVEIGADGSAELRLDIDEGPFSAEGTWFFEGDHAVTTAAVRS